MQPKAEPLWAAFDEWVNDCVEPRKDVHNNWEEHHAGGSAADGDEPQPAEACMGREMTSSVQSRLINKKV